MIEHLKYSSDNQNIMVNVDETICFYPDKRIYELAVPIKENIKKINYLYDGGANIIYYAQRGLTTKIDYYNLTKTQLEMWGCKYHKLIVDANFAWDLIIDEKSMRIDEL